MSSPSQRPTRSGETIKKRPSRPSPAVMTMRRREIYVQRRLEQQYAHGRPTDAWKLCGDKACWERCCISGVPNLVLQDRDWSTDKIPVKDISTDFSVIMTERIWLSKRWRSDNRLMKLNSIESFVASPPVRAAFREFKSLCYGHNVDATSEQDLREDLTVATTRFYNVMWKIGKPEHFDAVHAFLKPPKAAEDDPDSLKPAWTLQYCVMRFLLKAELWRRRDAQHLRRRLWTFGSPKNVAELLAAILLHFWIMDREKCFQSVPGKDELLWDETWQLWMDRYPLLTQEGEKDDDYTAAWGKKHDFVPLPPGGLGMDVQKEIGYIGAVGTYEPVWGGLKRAERREGDGLPQH